MPPTAGMLYRYFRARQDTSNYTVRCLYCTRKNRLLTFKQLKRGDHICMGGEILKSNFRQKQIYIYTHHAIVKQVEFINEAEAMLTMIHFSSTTYDKTIQIQETTHMKNLYNDEIYVVKYKHETRSVENIIERANSLVGKGLQYSLLSYNCEGFANWCVIGLEESYQAESALLLIRNLLQNFNNTIVGAALRRVAKLRLLSTTVDDAAALTPASGSAVFGVIALLYLCYCLYKVTVLKIKRDENEICSSCFSNRHCDIWTRFASFCVPQLFGYIAIVTMSFGATPVLGACSALSLLLMWGLPKLRRKLRSPFTGIKRKIICLSEIGDADVVSFSYYGMEHVGIVSSVHLVKQNTEYRLLGKFKIIHYARGCMLRSREIREETVIIDLNKTYLLLHDYSEYDIHAPADVLERAMKRIGERKFGIRENRSCHFCHWAKVKETTPMAESKYQEQKVEFLRSLESSDDMSNPIEANHMRGAKHATHTLSTNRAIIMDDVENFKGTLIQFKYRKLWHKAICTDVKVVNRPYVLIATVVHYGKKLEVIEEKLTFDLKHDDIYAYNFHPLYRYKADDVIRNARAKIGERKYNIFCRRSSHMAEEAIHKGKDKLVRRLDEVKKGDVISFLYRSLRHEAVVTGVTIDDSRSCKTGLINVVHYAWPRIFSTREVKEGPLDINLSRDKLYIKLFAGYTTYPADLVVKRARSRIGERKFHCIDNTSFDFVHWAKVIQQPCVLRVTPVDGTAHVDTRAGDNVHEGENVVLLPEVGKTVEQFQEDWAKTWDELQPGSIVKYRNYMYYIWQVGIVSEVHQNLNLIKVIHYGTNHLFAERTIREDSLSVDLQRDRVWVYRCDPRQCHAPDKVVQNAKARLGENKWSPGNRSWDFCKACTLMSCEEFHVDLAKTWDELTPGIIVKYRYHLNWDVGIVSGVDSSQAMIKVIHYGSNHVFAKRTLREETISVDLSHDLVWVYTCDPEICHAPDEVVHNANNKLREKKWRSGNKSWDFCKACTLMSCEELPVHVDLAET